MQEVSATHTGETGGRKEKQKGINCRVNLTRHKDLSRGVGVGCHPAVMKKVFNFYYVSLWSREINDCLAGKMEFISANLLVEVQKSRK